MYEYGLKYGGKSQSETNKLIKICSLSLKPRTNTT